MHIIVEGGGIFALRETKICYYHMVRFSQSWISWHRLACIQCRCYQHSDFKHNSNMASVLVVTDYERGSDSISGGIISDINQWFSFHLLYCGISYLFMRIRYFAIHKQSFRYDMNIRFWYIPDIRSAYTCMQVIWTNMVTAFTAYD